MTRTIAVVLFFLTFLPPLIFLIVLMSALFKKRFKKAMLYLGLIVAYFLLYITIVNWLFSDLTFIR